MTTSSKKKRRTVGNNNGYHCVHCLAPSESTYRTFGREIKLTTCFNCGQNVDPYVERDWLLVAMDCILVRQEAYRHVLCNRRAGRIQDSNNNNQTTAWKNHPQYSYWIASAVLQGYVYLAPFKTSFLLTWMVEILIVDDKTSAAGLEWLPLVCSLYAFLGDVSLWCGLQGSWMLWKTKTTTTRLSPLPPAILWPTWFHAITMLLLVVWENTPTVRQLASLLVLGYQYCTTTVVFQLSDPEAKPFQLAGIFLFGVIVRSLGLAGVRWSLQQYFSTLPEMECLLGIPDPRNGIVTWNDWVFCLY